MRTKLIKVFLLLIVTAVLSACSAGEMNMLNAPYNECHKTGNPQACAKADPNHSYYLTI